MHRHHRADENRSVLAAALPGGGNVEIGWQLDAALWGKGLAPEGAAACLEHAFDVLHLPEVVAFTYAGNAPSRRVMEKLGMSEQGSFEHPALLPGHRLRPHVLYRKVAPVAG
jgi:RimJ/RimL family protein N-acetyltransferase